MINIHEYSVKSVIHLTRKMHLYPLKIAFSFIEFRKSFHGLLPRNPLLDWSKLLLFFFLVEEQEHLFGQCKSCNIHWCFV